MSPSLIWKSEEDAPWQLRPAISVPPSCCIPEDIPASAVKSPALPHGIRQKLTSRSDVRATAADLLFLKYLTNIDYIYPLFLACVKFFYCLSCLVR